MPQFICNLLQALFANCMYKAQRMRNGMPYGHVNCICPLKIWDGQAQSLIHLPCLLVLSPSFLTGALMCICDVPTVLSASLAKEFLQWAAILRSTWFWLLACSQQGQQAVLASASISSRDDCVHLCRARTQLGVPPRWQQTPFPRLSTSTCNRDS